MVMILMMMISFTIPPILSTEETKVTLTTNDQDKKDQNKAVKSELVRVELFKKWLRFANVVENYPLVNSSIIIPDSIKLL